MNPRGRPWERIALLAAVLCSAGQAHATIEYSVSVARPATHVLGVTMHVPNVHDRVTLQMPAWNGLYQIRDFASHMMQLRLQSSGFVSNVMRQGPGSVADARLHATARS